jgi:focal adhesion kinase 1
MTKTLIKVYFNNGCTTLVYSDSTTVDEIIRLVIKGRLSLNELRYRQCFRLRSTKFSLPFKDFDPSDSETTTSPGINSKIDEFFWLRNDLTIKEWLNSINDSIDDWKLQLKVRYISGDLNEVKFKDPITFGYFYEQVNNDFVHYLAPSLTDPGLVPVLLDLGCLEMRRTFQHMIPNVLDKKANYEYLEKEVGLARFFPELVLQHKAKNLKKMIIKGLKTYENLNESDCMFKFLEKVLQLWKYNEESYHCILNDTKCEVTITHLKGILIKAEGSNVIKKIDFKQLLQIITEQNENQKDESTLKFKISEAKDLLILKTDSKHEAEDMASLIDGYCSLCSKQPNSTIWISLRDEKTRLDKKNSFKGPGSRARSLTSNQTEPDRHKTPTRGSESERKKSLNCQTQISADRNSDQILSELKTDYYLESVKCFQIQPAQLTFHELLGSGQFGEVFRGVYKNNSHIMDVAIKKLKITDSIDEMEQDDFQLIAKRFLREAKIMHGFDHPHIIKLIGICEPEPLAIVMELAKFGQLKNYLQTYRSQIDLSSLLSYCGQLSNAMAYLEKKKYVHRDIAARNVLVVNHECVKLSDFGLSRELNENAYLACKSKLPIKWMAPESINFSKFTSQSDVWMFGICAWEILSYGAKPFQGIKNAEVIKLIEERKVLEKPQACPGELYALMLKCWEYDSMLRPKFSQIREQIQALIQTPTRHFNQNDSVEKFSSSSNGSSFHSNSSISSALSLATNTAMNTSPTPTLSTNTKSDALSSETGSVTDTMLMILNAPAKNSNYSLTNSNLNPTSFELSTQNSDQSLPSKPPKLKMDAFYSSPVKSKLADSKNQTQTSVLKDEPDSIINHRTNNVTKTELSDRFRALDLKQESINDVLTNPPVAKLDLVLRDQTLKLIQTISNFIRYLNGSDPRLLDDQLKEIVDTLKELIALIENIELSNASKKIAGQIGALETSLSSMVNEFKGKNVEHVVSSALELARTANELFLTITTNS